jgi:teichoic acid transport system permease protein
MKKKWLFAVLCMIFADAALFLLGTSPFPNIPARIMGQPGQYYNGIISNAIWSGIVDIIIFVCFALAKKLFIIPLSVFTNRGLLWSLAKNDFRTRFAGSYLGIFWAFINPVVTIVLYWIIFQFAFKSGPQEGVPFVLWLTSGLVPWFLFQDALSGGTNSMIEYGYLVKKVVFQVDILPAIKVISCLFVHFVFLGFTVIICCFLGYFPTVYTIQVFYYMICLIAYVTGLVYMTSSIVLFFRDLGQFINVFMQVFMWLTPIMWSSNIVPPHLVWIFKINPMFYVITGYRDSLLYGISITQHMGYTIYFWIAVIVVFLLGTTIFRRLRPHFADVM